MDPAIIQDLPRSTVEGILVPEQHQQLTNEKDRAKTELTALLAQRSTAALDMHYKSYTEYLENKTEAIGDRRAMQERIIALEDLARARKSSARRTKEADRLSKKSKQVEAERVQVESKRVVAQIEQDVNEAIRKAKATAASSWWPWNTQQ